MAKPLAAHCHRLDVRQMAREGVLVPGATSAWGWWADKEHTQQVASGTIRAYVSDFVFEYADDEGNNYSQGIILLRTPCNYGGSRVWMQCPRCGKRVAILYWGNGARYLRCRTCYDLAYHSQRTGPYWRMWDKYRELLEKMEGGKPKGMHRKTWGQLVTKADRYDQAVCLAMQAKGYA